MALVPRTRLGPHEIGAQIGLDGMGGAYRTKDTNLGRDVAIKVLLEAFAGVTWLRRRRPAPTRRAAGAAYEQCPAGGSQDRRVR